MLKDIEEIRAKVHQVVQEQLVQGYCLVSRVRNYPHYFAFQDNTRQNTGVGCLVGVIVGDDAPTSGFDWRPIASKKVDISEDEMIAIEMGFEGRSALWINDERGAQLHQLGVEIREAYNA